MLRVWDVRDGQCVRELALDDAAESDFDISDDGRYAITAGTHSVRLWDLTEGRCLREFKDPVGGPRSVCLSGDGRVAVVSNLNNNTVSVLDFASGRCRLTIDDQGRPGEVAISRDGRLLLTATELGEWHGHLGDKHDLLRVWEVTTGRCVRVIDRSVIDRMGGAQLCLCLSDDGSLAVAAQFDGKKVRVWDLRRERVLTLDGHTGKVHSLSVSGEFLVTTGEDHTVRLWSLDNGRCLRTFRQQDGLVIAAYFDRDAGVMVSAWRNNFIRWWTVPPRHTAPLLLSRPREHAELSRLDARVTGLMDRARLAADAGEALELLTEARAVPGYERDPRLLAAWRELDRSAVRVGLRAAWLARVFEGPDDNNLVEISADGRIAVSARRSSDFRGWNDGGIRVWDVGSGTCLRVVREQVRALGLSSDGTRILSADREGFTTWSVETGERISTLDHESSVSMSASPIFDSAGRLALVAETDGAIRLWNLISGACEQEIAGRWNATALWLGQELAVGGVDKVVRLWNLRNGECLRTLGGHTSGVLSVCLSPDGRHILSSDHLTIRLWDVVAGECLRVFGDESRPWRVRFSPEGRFAFSAGSDANVRIWDLATGRCLRAMDENKGTVQDLAVGPNGQFLLSVDSGGFATTGGAIRRWELDWDLRVP
jgi:WD40 repeat protein